MKKINNSSILSQAEMIENFYDYILKHGKPYSKSRLTLIRPGVVGEIIETIVESGLETRKVVSANEYVVQALTLAKEQYVITEEKFKTRYQLASLSDTNPPTPEGFTLYVPTGKIIGLKAEEILESTEAYFMAAWGEKMKVQPEDILAIPVGLKPEIYRIAWSEFMQTYS